MKRDFNIHVNKYNYINTNQGRFNIEQWAWQTVYRIPNFLFHFLISLASMCSFIINLFLLSLTACSVTQPQELGSKTDLYPHTFCWAISWLLETLRSELSSSLEASLVAYCLDPLQFVFAFPFPFPLIFHKGLSALSTRDPKFSRLANHTTNKKCH